MLVSLRLAFAEHSGAYLKKKVRLYAGTAAKPAAWHGVKGSQAGVECRDQGRRGYLWSATGHSQSAQLAAASSSPAERDNLTQSPVVSERLPQRHPGSIGRFVRSRIIGQHLAKCCDYLAGLSVMDDPGQRDKGLPVIALLEDTLGSPHKLEQRRRTVGVGIVIVPGRNRGFQVDGIVDGVRPSVGGQELVMVKNSSCRRRCPRKRRHWWSKTMPCEAYCGPGQFFL